MATIRDIGSKIKALASMRREDIYVIFVILLVALFAFGLGRLSVIYGQKDELKIISPAGQSAESL